MVHDSGLAVLGQAEDGHIYSHFWASLVGQTVKNRLQCGRPEFDPWVGKIP